MISSLFRNGPFAVRYSIILWAVVGSIPGNVSSSANEAVLMLIRSEGFTVVGTGDRVGKGEGEGEGLGVKEAINSMVGKDCISAIGVAEALVISGSNGHSRQVG